MKNNLYKEKRADVNFWYNDKKGKPMIQTALGVKLDTREKMETEVEKYCEDNGYTLTFILGITPRK